MQTFKPLGIKGFFDSIYNESFEAMSVSIYSGQGQFINISHLSTIFDILLNLE